MKPSLELLRALPLDGPVDTLALAARAGLDMDRTAVGLLALQRTGFVTIHHGTVTMTRAGRAALSRLAVPSSAPAKGVAP